MDFKKSVKTYFQKYATFNGRASRSEFWYFWLLTFAVYAIVLILSNTILLILYNIVPTADVSIGLIVVLGVFFLATLIPLIAVTARRLHDVNKSGWFQIIPLPFLLFTDLLFLAGVVFPKIPPVLIGVGLYIYLIVLYCSEGGKKNNRFGKSINLRKKG